MGHACYFWVMILCMRVSDLKCVGLLNVRVKECAYVHVGGVLWKCSRALSQASNTITGKIHIGDERNQQWK